MSGNRCLDYFDYRIGTGSFRAEDGRVKQALTYRRYGDTRNEDMMKSKYKEHSKLRGRIVEKYGSQGEFAKRLGRTEQSITAKLNGRSQFSQRDIVNWSNALEIEVSEVGFYFFADKL